MLVFLDQIVYIVGLLLSVVIPVEEVRKDLRRKMCNLFKYILSNSLVFGMAGMLMKQDDSYVAVVLQTL